MRREYCLVFLSPLLLAIVGVTLFSVIQRGRHGVQEDVPGERLYEEVMTVVDDHYVTPLDEKELVERIVYGAAKGVARELDRHTVVYDSKEWNASREKNAGRYTGVGIYTGRLGKQITVFYVIPRGPADRAGLRAGDRILEIDGEVITESAPLQTVLRSLRSDDPRGIPLVVTDWDGEDRRELNLVPGAVPQQTAYGAILDEESGLAYVRISSFRGNTDRLFGVVVDSLATQGMRRMVLDLRGNGGGMLDVAERIADRFLGQGPIVSVVGRNDREERRAEAALDDLRIPLVVLIDGESASASEVVAGALQDHARALLVGERSFGKGVVQTLYPFRSAPGGIKLTTSHYFTPAGRCIEKSLALPDGRSRRGGLQPDLFVPVDRTTRGRIEVWRDALRYRPEIRRAYLADRERLEVLPLGFEDPQMAAAVAMLDGDVPDRSLGVE